MEIYIETNSILYFTVADVWHYIKAISKKSLNEIIVYVSHWNERNVELFHLPWNIENDQGRMRSMEDYGRINYVTKID